MKTNLITMLQSWPQDLNPEEMEEVVNKFYQRELQVTALLVLTISTCIFGTLISRRHPFTGASVAVLGFNGAMISRDCSVVLENIKNIFSSHYHQHLNYSNMPLLYKAFHQLPQLEEPNRSQILNGTLLLEPFMRSAVQKMLEKQKAQPQTIQDFLLHKFCN